MSNRIIKEIKSLHVKVEGGVSDGININSKLLDVIITNDSIGKSISIHDGEKMFTIPFEPIEKYLR